MMDIGFRAVEELSSARARLDPSVPVGKTSPTPARLQAQVFGQAALQTVEAGLSTIPVVGEALAGLLDLGAATYEGRRAPLPLWERHSKTAITLLRATPAAAPSHAQREATFFAAVQQRVAQLQHGGVLTVQDVQGFEQSVAYGYIYVNGFDLSKMTFTAGTTPFVPKVDSVPVVVCNFRTGSVAVPAAARLIW
jgi:hypothetical protein